MQTSLRGVPCLLVKTLIIFCSLFLANALWAGWKRLDSGVDVTLTDVCFPAGPDTGFVVGSYGTILKTLNGGLIWEKLNSGIKTYLYRVEFPKDCRIGYVLSGWNDTDTLLKTVDGGMNWAKINVGTDGSLQGIHFPEGPEVGYILGTKDTIIEGVTIEKGAIFKTTDSGKTWIRQIGFPDFGGLQAVWFVNNDTGYVVGIGDINRGPTILKTTNGGETWIDKTPLYNPDLWESELTDVCFPQGSLVGYAGGPWLVIKTNDGGDNWEEITPKDRMQRAGRCQSGAASWMFSYSWDWLCFPIDTLVGYGNGGEVNNYSRIWKTTDGGATWSKQDSVGGAPVGWKGVLAADFIDANIGYAVGDSGVILKTIDGGSGIEDAGSNDLHAPKLYPNRPNPFSKITQIEYELPFLTFVTFNVYDIAGRAVCTLVKGQKSAGLHKVLWNGQNDGGKLPSGIYFFSLELTDVASRDQTIRLTGKMEVLR